MNCDCYHIPVMLHECLAGLNICPDGTYVDLTYGGGGHSKEIVSLLGSKGHLYGFDQDLDAMNGAMTDERFTLVRSNFRFVGNWMQYYGVDEVDGILADLGVSSHHLDEAERGFSFRYDAPLDMRMNQRSSLTAQKIVSDYSEEQLAEIFYTYGELRQSRRIASAIVKNRLVSDIKTTGELSNIVSPLLGKDREKKDLARVFQALRIEVNGEMRVLREMLDAATRLLRPGGRLVVMTYHSLEDRIVKNHIKNGYSIAPPPTHSPVSNEELLFGRRKEMLRDVNRGVTVPTETEQMQNPRSRSAKLRIAEKR